MPKLLQKVFRLVQVLVELRIYVGVGGIGSLTNGFYGKYSGNYRAGYY